MWTLEKHFLVFSALQLHVQQSDIKVDLIRQKENLIFWA